MSESMVERVARAIHVSQWGDVIPWGDNFTEKENCLSRARVAIEAMRDAFAREPEVYAALDAALQERER